MSAQSHDFNLLNLWATWPDSEIERVISKESIAAMERVVRLLADESESEKIVVNDETFVQLVHEMRKLYKIGSRSLGETILEASQYVDNQEIEKAKEVKEVYEHFLSSCASKFYRDIAKSELDKLS